MKKLNKIEKALGIFILILAVFCAACTKTKPSDENTKTVEVLPDQPGQIEALPENQLEQTSLSMEKFAKLREGLYEKGGIALFESGEIYDVPEEFEKQSVRIFGVEGDYFPPAEPYKEILITFIIEDENLHIMLPADVYEKSPELYIEAEHDGKTFIYKDKKPLNFHEEKNIDLIGYHASVYFTNRNICSKSDEWKFRLKNCQNDELVAEQTLTRKAVACGYVVYSEEYENPFVRNENCGIKPDTQYHLIYMGKGGSFPDEGTMAVFSYGYYTNRQLLYIPFLGVKTKTDKDGICTFDFSIREPGQYKLDFYDVPSGKITYTSFFDFINVSRLSETEYVETVGTEWKVNSPEGLRLRDSPWGEKVGLLRDGTELIQTENAHYPFYDFIDGHHGFWIPVRQKNPPETSDVQEKPEIFCDSGEQTEGWVFSSFLTK